MKRLLSALKSRRRMPLLLAGIVVCLSAPLLVVIAAPTLAWSQPRFPENGPLEPTDFVSPIGTDENPVIRRPGSEEARTEVQRYGIACRSSVMSGAAQVGACEDALRYERGLNRVLGRTYMNAARAYLAYGDVRRARDAFDNGVRNWDREAAPQDPLPNFTDYRRADHANAHCEFARFLWRAGDTIMAQAQLTTAIAYDPLNSCAIEAMRGILANQPPPEGPLPTQRDYVAPPPRQRRSALQYHRTFRTV